MMLQERDVHILKSLAKQRHLTSDHIRLLHFPGRTRSPAQVRLRKLWENRFVNRRFLPVVLDGRRPRSLRPLYVLSKKGATMVADDTGTTVRDVHHDADQGTVFSPTLLHDLIVTDFVTSLEAALRDHRQVKLHAVLREPELWQTATAWQRRTGLRILVSDGAVTLAHDDDRARSFHLEIVKAGTKGGNHALIRKLARYADHHRQGYFAQAFGHERLRAILLATTSPERAENLRQLAAQHLRHGRRLFWFGAYPKDPSANMPPTTFTPDMVLDPMWTDTGGETYSIIQPDTGAPRA